MREVKFKVQSTALLLREFTVADIVGATGLNPESVRTELQRMRRCGVLSSHPMPSAAGRNVRGAKRYRLTNDPVALRALSEDVEAFYPSIQSVDRPTSRHYFRAMSLLDQASKAPQADRAQITAQALEDLAFAEETEGGSSVPPRIKAYLDFERARAAYINGSIKLAMTQFARLREVFARDSNHAMVALIEEFLICLDVRSRLSSYPLTTADPTARLRATLDILDKRIEGEQADRPLVGLLQQLTSAVLRERFSPDIRDLHEIMTKFSGIEAPNSVTPNPELPSLSWQPDSAPKYSRRFAFATPHRIQVDREDLRVMVSDEGSTVGITLMSKSFSKEAVLSNASPHFLWDRDTRDVVGPSSKGAAAREIRKSSHGRQLREVTVQHEMLSAIGNVQVP